MYTIYPDVLVTRRMRMHHIFDDREQLVFSSPELDMCVAWLIDKGETKCLIHGPAIPSEYRVTMEFGC